MIDNSIYQQARSYLAYLRMASAAEALPAELEYAASQKLGHTAFWNGSWRSKSRPPRPAGEPASRASTPCPRRSA